MYCIILTCFLIHPSFHHFLPCLFSRVRLLVNRKTEEAVAVKVVDVSSAKECMDNVKKEVCVHKMLSHPNIVRFYGHRSEGSIHYIFLEYCSGGELFDRIGECWSWCVWRFVGIWRWHVVVFGGTEPDVGMPEKEAHRLFQQLIAGVVSNGIWLLFTFTFLSFSGHFNPNCETIQLINYLIKLIHF